MLNSHRILILKELIWSYYFYAEGEGNIDSLDGRKMIHDLKKLCENVKILGSFSDEKILDERGAE